MASATCLRRPRTARRSCSRRRASTPAAASERSPPLRCRARSLRSCSPRQLASLRAYAGQVAHVGRGLPIGLGAHTFYRISLTQTAKPSDRGTAPSRTIAGTRPVHKGVHAAGRTPPRRRPDMAVAIPSGDSLLVGLTPLSLGRQGQCATSEVATWDDRAGLGRPYGHGLSLNPPCGILDRREVRLGRSEEVVCGLTASSGRPCRLV